MRMIDFHSASEGLGMYGIHGIQYRLMVLKTNFCWQLCHLPSNSSPSFEIKILLVSEKVIQGCLISSNRLVCLTGTQNSKQRLNYFARRCGPSTFLFIFLSSHPPLPSGYGKISYHRRLHNDKIMTQLVKKHRLHGTAPNFYI